MQFHGLCSTRLALLLGLVAGGQEWQKIIPAGLHMDFGSAQKNKAPETKMHKLLALWVLYGGAEGI